MVILRGFGELLNCRRLWFFVVWERGISKISIIWSSGVGSGSIKGGISGDIFYSKGFNHEGCIEFHFGGLGVVFVFCLR